MILSVDLKLLLSYSDVIIYIFVQLTFLRFGSIHPFSIRAVLQSVVVKMKPREKSPSIYWYF